MATLQQQIAQKFLVKLAKSNDFDDAKIAQMKALLGDGKKVKPEDLVKIFTLPAGGDLK